jgi:hypothetical protein
VPNFTVFCLRTDYQITDLAKISPHILNPEKFALHLATFFVSKYAHISKAFVAVEQLRWSRIHVTGEQFPEGHSHSFYRDGDDKRIVKVEVGVLLCVVIFPDNCNNVVEYRSTQQLGKTSWSAR